MTAADICRERGWGKDTLLFYEFGFTPSRIKQTVYVITAIGEEAILIRAVGWKWKHFKRWNKESRSEQVHHGDIVMHAIPHLPWETPKPPPKCNHCKQPGSIDHAGLCDRCSRELSEFSGKQAMASHMESVPVDPAIQAKVAAILKKRGFKEYQ